MEKLREACREWGIFRVVNHGVPTLLMDQIKSVARDLFSQPFESKRSLFSADGDHATSSSYSWGTPALTSSGRPLSVQEVNWVEGFNFTGFQMTSPDAAASSSSSDPLTLVEEYGEHAGRIARKMVEAIGELLGGVDCGAYVAESTGIIRVYRYPQTHTAAAAALGMQPHTDSSVVSILLEDDKVSGLQFIKGQRWLTLNPVSDTLLVNVGDMIQAISDDEFKSVKHRVKIDKHEEDRISICYFVFPDKDKIIETSKYKPFTYKDFQQQVQEDTKTLGFKVGLERFKRLI
ncbi:Gibberellin 2-beta-dioxygenase 8 [Linum perenne]